MEELKGAIITGLEIDDAGQSYLVFYVKDAEPVIYFAEGECCSQSWFYSVMDPQVLFGQEVLEVEEVAMPVGQWDDPDPDDVDCGRGDYTQFYGYGLRTAKGICRIEFRNSSNGYYGGSLTKQATIHPGLDVKMRWVLGDYIAGSDNNVLL